MDRPIGWLSPGPHYRNKVTSVLKGKWLVQDQDQETWIRIQKNPGIISLWCQRPQPETSGNAPAGGQAGSLFDAGGSAHLGEAAPHLARGGGVWYSGGGTVTLFPSVLRRNHDTELLCLRVTLSEAGVPDGS